MFDFINETTENIAQQLLGKLIIYKKNGVIYSGYIVETEAYLGSIDMACHSYNGKRTRKNEVMYLPGGHIYIYTIHTHKMLNIVTKQINIPEAVLIRAIEPLEGIENMRKNRKNLDINLTNGPGKLTKAFEIGDDLNGSYLQDSGDDNIIFIDYEKSKIPKRIINTARIGIPNKGDWTGKKLRYYVKGNAFVSGVKRKEVEEENGWIKK